MVQFLQKWLFLTICIAHLYRIPLAKTEDIKTWCTNTNFLNPRNWKDGQLPCANDRIIFPDSPVITIMPESFTAGELILPYNGGIIFPENAVIELTGGKLEGACSGKDVNFLRTVDYWYDPLNWNITSDRAFPRIPNRKNLAVPHAFQVPCRTDNVQFPYQTTFQTDIVYPITTVSTVNISGVNYNTQREFDEFRRSHIGTLMFPGGSYVRITDSVCIDESGCTCGNDAPRVLPTICAQVTPYCPTIECSDPITPDGNCCPICGVQIMIKHQLGFELNKLMSLHDSFLSKEEFQGVESFTSKTYKKDIQSVFVDGDKYKGRANKVAQLIYDTLNSDINSDNTYSIQSLKMFKSENWNSGVPTYDQLVSRGMSSGGVAALVIVLIVGLGLAAAFFIYKKRHVPGFNFARFDLRGDKIELELGTTPHDELQPVDPPLPSSTNYEKSKGFDNPVYGTTVEEAVPSSAAEPPAEVRDFVENPMFMIFEDSPKQAEGENE